MSDTAPRKWSSTQQIDEQKKKAPLPVGTSPGKGFLSRAAPVPPGQTPVGSRPPLPARGRTIGRGRGRGGSRPPPQMNRPPSSSNMPIPPKSKRAPPPRVTTDSTGRIARPNAPPPVSPHPREGTGNQVKPPPPAFPHPRAQQKAPPTMNRTAVPPEKPKVPLKTTVVGEPTVPPTRTLSRPSASPQRKLEAPKNLPPPRPVGNVTKKIPKVGPPPTTIAPHPKTEPKAIPNSNNLAPPVGWKANTLVSSPEKKRSPSLLSQTARKASPAPKPKIQLTETIGSSEIESALISSEKSFITMCTSGLDTFSMNIESPFSTSNTGDLLFGNLQHIVDTHSKAVNTISSQGIVGFMTTLQPHSGMYLTYLANLSHSFQLLAKLRDKEFEFFTKITSSEESSSSFTIEVLMDKPKQHLLEMVSLLSKFMSSGSPESLSPEAKEAFNSLHKVKQEVDKRSMLPTHLVRLWDIENSFKENIILLHEEKEILIEGIATIKRDGKSEFLRVLIFPGLVILAIPNKSSYWEILLQSTIQNLTVSEILDSPQSLTFTAKDNTQSVTIEAPIMSERAVWMNYLPVEYPNGKRPLKQSITF